VDCILTNCKILDMAQGCNGFHPGDSVLIRDGLIMAIGTYSECLAAATHLPDETDLRGKVLLPGFTDTHTHFVEHAKNLFLLDLNNCHTIDSIMRTAESYRKKHTELPEWILGGGWDVNTIDMPSQINRHLLDTLFPDVPVALFSKDYHAKWCNTLALKLCGIHSSTPNPSGGLITMDASGEPTGLLYESATEIVDKYAVHPSSYAIISAIRTRLAEMYRMGLTGFHSMESVPSMEMLRACLENGSLFRYCWHFPYEELDGMIEQGVQSYTAIGLITLGGVKLFADGALGSRTAAMHRPYPENAGSGVLRYSQDDMISIIDRASDHGIACTVHAIGDKAVYIVASAFHARTRKHPVETLGHRMEHVQCVAPEDIPLLAESKLYCAMQPIHLANDVPMIERYWPSVENRAYPWADIVNARMAYGFGSDVPIESNNPFHGIYCATQRKYRNDPTQPAWHPEQAISPMQAIHGYTLGAASGSREDRLRGSIETGKQADLIVLDDWTNQGPEFWLNCHSRFTMVAGRIVHYDLE